MYAGIAAGNNNAHSRNDLNGKLYRVTIHAVETPKIKLKEPTPTINIKVLIVYLGNTVEKR
tara:strand:+ start:47 stop:229 length:183 start_codon:yes stop_codon:yes gene_type:complete